MPKQRPPHLQRRKTRHGKYIWVVQVSHGAPVIRIRAEYGTPEFDEEYQAALSSGARRAVRKTKPVHSGTLEWAWQLHRQSATWAALSRATRKQRENIMLNVLKNGNPPLSRINRAAISAGLDRRRDTPSQAKNFLQTMRALFGWLADNGIVRQDPTIGMVLKQRRKTGGFLVWSDEDLTAYEQRWPLGTRERVMLDVFLYTGLRRGDAARVGPAHVRNGVISLVTEKTTTPVDIPVLPILQRTLDAGPTGKLSFICKQDGMPYVKESLGNAFKEACVAAGVLDKSAHGLRKVAATRLAENGATVNELMAIFGWTDAKEAELYTRSADRKKLAARAMSKLER